MDEKLKKALECCSRWDCCACPMVSEVNCTKNLPAEAKRYIDDLEERLAIMRESMEAQEKQLKEREELARNLHEVQHQCNIIERYEQDEKGWRFGAKKKLFDDGNNTGK